MFMRIGVGSDFPHQCEAIEGHDSDIGVGTRGEIFQPHAQAGRLFVQGTRAVMHAIRSALTSAEIEQSSFSASSPAKSCAVPRSVPTQTINVLVS